MIKISAPNESAIVHQIIGNAIHREDCPSPDSKATLTPSLDGLSISTTSSNQTSDNKDQTKYNGDREQQNGSEFNDCSSSLSSQDSSNVLSSYTAKTFSKRSVFSQYWQKTGQKPVSLRPIRSLSTSDISPPSLHSLSTLQESERTSWTGSTCEASSESLKASSSQSPPENPLSCAVTNAELLEDDGDSSLYEDDGTIQGSADPPYRASEEPSQPPPIHQPLVRRRSILPPAPTSHPALRATLGKTSARSWRKSASLNNVEEYSRSTPLHARQKTRSLPGIRSSSSSSSFLQSPGPSCLRPQPRYSPDTTSQRSLAPSPSPSRHSLPSMPDSTNQLERRLSRADSTTSSVSFQEAVDVRHFEPPRETYSGKGWSDYFSFETTTLV